MKKSITELQTGDVFVFHFEPSEYQVLTCTRWTKEEVDHYFGPDTLRDTAVFPIVYLQYIPRGASAEEGEYGYIEAMESEFYNPDLVVEVI